MINQRDLAQRLARRNLGGWSIAERIQDLAIVDEQRALHRLEHRTRLTLIVHQDIPLGRGSARLDIDAYDGSADDLINQAIALALAAVGPAWTSPPPAAPAKVTIADPDLIERDLDAVATATLARLQRPADITLTATARALRERVTVVASSGFHTTWTATSLHADALLTLARPSSGNPTASPLLGDRATPTLHVARSARRLDDLRFDLAIADAATDLHYLATATPPAPGRCALWIGPEALLHGNSDHDTTYPFGLWTIFARQADSAVERHGLTRYRWRSEIAPGAAQIPEPLTITSNGALDHATRSLPVTDDAVAIRSFPIIDRGTAIGLALSPREAALRRTDPNGGVRNLIIPPGTWTPSPSATTRTLELRRLRSLTIDLTTGEATLDIALAFDHLPDRPVPIPITGGTLRLDLIRALARARRSAPLLQRGAYHGPSAILVEDADLLP